MGRTIFKLIFLLQLLLSSSLFAQDFELLIEVSDGTVDDTLTIGVDPDKTHRRHRSVFDHVETGPIGT